MDLWERIERTRDDPEEEGYRRCPICGDWADGGCDCDPLDREDDGDEDEA